MNKHEEKSIEPAKTNVVPKASEPKKKKTAPKKELSSADKFKKDMMRPIRVRVKNLESNLPVYVGYHFDPDLAPEIKTIESDEMVELPLGAVLDLMINQIVYNEKPKYDIHGKYAGKQGANHHKYTVQLLDPIEDKYHDYVEKRTRMRQMIK